jgi:2-desacetyl-2-hydroxyethyl bacteriochlorophyllide A dehydrogenase
MVTCGSCVACQRGDTNHCPTLQVFGGARPGAFANEVNVPAGNLRPIPDSMTWDEAVLVEPTGIAVHCCNRAGLAAGDRVAVLGAGSIGLLIQQVAKARGASYILATGRQAGKLALAKQMGADETVDTSHQEVVTEERLSTFDLVFDCIGGDQAIDQAIKLLRPGGRILALAVPHTGALSLNYGEFYRKELTMRGARLYDSDFDEAITLIASGQVKPLPIITHRFSLDQGPQALLEVVNNRQEAIKILLIP